MWTTTKAAPSPTTTSSSPSPSPKAPTSYTVDGEKLSKALTGGGATKNYISGIEYSGANLEAIYFSEGRCTDD